jgi:uncharacterized protein YggE
MTFYYLINNSFFWLCNFSFPVRLTFITHTIIQATTDFFMFFTINQIQRLMKSSLAILALLILTVTDGLAQSTITVDATGEVHVPADIVNFQINIRVTGRTPAEVFQKHKEQESFLSVLIRERGLDGDKLNFQPMNINSRQSRDSRDYMSSQNVRLQLDDFELYEEIQVMLIENGFENFSGRFSSTRLESGENEALDLAIANAKSKAERIAENIGKSLGEVESIDHTAARIIRGFEMVHQTAMRAESDSMMQFDQTVPVSSNVRIVFKIAD